MTQYTYDSVGNSTPVTDAKGYTISYEYDGNRNLVKTTDTDGFVTEYTYNKTGDLVEMTDWTGTTTFEIDLLHRITAATDRLSKQHLRRSGQPD